jgi:hypothetical protein
MKFEVRCEIVKEDMVLRILPVSILPSPLSIRIMGVGGNSRKIFEFKGVIGSLAGHPREFLAIVECDQVAESRA